MTSPSTAHPQPHPLVHDGVTVHGWKISTVKGPIIADKDADDFRHAIGEGTFSLPEMLFNQSRLTLLHEATGTCIDLSALDALREWRQEGLPALQVTGAEAWKSARQQEICQQQAVQLQYDWTYTTPYNGTIVLSESSSVGAPSWQETSEQIDRALLMERDPILFFDEVPLYESDLDDTGVCQLTAKLRVMPKCWFLLLRLWIRVDGSMARLRETRLFCRHDLPHTSGTVLREVRHVEGSFKELRAAGAPEEGPSYADGDAAAAVFQAVSPTGTKLHKLEKLVLQ